MQLIETPIFTRQVTAAMDDDQYRLMQLHLLQRPDAGETIRASGGLRKLRWRLPGRGKRGGARIIYYWKRAQDADLVPDRTRLRRRYVMPYEISRIRRLLGFTPAMTIQDGLAEILAAREWGRARAPDGRAIARPRTSVAGGAAGGEWGRQ